MIYIQYKKIYTVNDYTEKKYYLDVLMHLKK